MARFPFSMSRKKSPPQPILPAEPMTKAHKILGSTPINIDSPQPWDDASSAFSTGTADSILTSRTSTETDPSDHHVAIASLEEECTNDLEFLPAIRESSTLDSDNDLGLSDVAHAVPAIPLAKGVPPKIHKMLDLEGCRLNKNTKKSILRDFPNPRSTYRMLQRGLSHQPYRDTAIVYEPGSATKTSSTISLITTPTGKHSRKMQKCNINNSMHSFALQEPQTHSFRGRLRGNSFKRIPSLYDHYEQMTLRHLMQQEEQEEPEEEEEEEEEIKQIESTNHIEKTGTSPLKDSGPTQDLLRSRGPLLTTSPQTDSTAGLATAPSHPRPKSSGSQLTAGRLDLQKTSMLMLDSDSEDEGKKELSTLPRRRQTNNSGHRPSKAHLSSCTVSLAQSERAPSHGPNCGSLRNSKRTSFASANTYITIPNSSRLTTDTAIPIGIDSRPSTSHGADHASCRTSLMSNGSSIFAFQRSSNYIQEARAVTMMAGRRPCCVQYGDEHKTNSPPSTASLPPTPPRHPNVAPIPPEQPTPPLSPTSVDFYIRSARSSIDGPGSHNRYMAVSRQEEMLLSALRHKKYPQKEKPACDSAEPSQQPKEDDLNIIQEEDGFQETGSTVAEGIFDFGFPVPPSSRKQSFLRNTIASSTSTGSRTSTATDKISQSSIRHDHSSVLGSCRHSPSAQPRLKSILKKPKLQEEGVEQEQVILCLDNGEAVTQHAEFSEPSPDMTDFSYITMPSMLNDDSESCLVPTDSPVLGAPTRPLPSLSAHVAQGKRIDRGYRSPTAMASVPEDGELDNDMREDIPRPDSPISPDAFPAVPQIRSTLRTTLNRKARLSAVGPTMMMSEPRW